MSCESGFIASTDTLLVRQLNATPEGGKSAGFWAPGIGCSILWEDHASSSARG